MPPARASSKGKEKGGNDVISDVPILAAGDCLVSGTAKSPPVAVPPVVSPEKESVPRIILQVDAAKVFYIVNLVTKWSEKYASQELAVTAQTTLQRFMPEQSEDYVLKEFDSVGEFSTFMASFYPPTAGNDKPDVTVPIAGVFATKRTQLLLDKAEVKRPRLAFSSEQASTSSDPGMQNLEKALRASTAPSVEVFHLVLPGSAFDVWCFTVKDNVKDLWTWKPVCLEKAIIAEAANPLFASNNTTMDEMLLFTRAATIRETPRGPNVPSQLSYSKGRKLDRMLMWGLCDSPSDEDSVKKLVISFFNNFGNEKIQLAYYLAMQNTLRSDTIISETKPNTTLYNKLKEAVENIKYKPIGCLSEMFLDETIINIISNTYNYGGGVSPSMWDKDVFKIAFGESK
jgi:hypothetical protein